MGYVVLHLDKSPDNEVPMTAHIARTKMPPNAIPELTYLNEELVEYPKGVADRTEAINHRLNHAGLTRKIGTNQVRVIRVMLTGSQEDMKRLAQEGRLKAWCADNLTWLRKTFGTENVVSAVLHMDEATLSVPKMSFRQSYTWTKRHRISTRRSFPSLQENAAKSARENPPNRVNGNITRNPILGLDCVRMT